MPDNLTTYVMLRMTPEEKERAQQAQVLAGFRALSGYVLHVLLRDIEIQEDKARQRAQLED